MKQFMLDMMVAMMPYMMPIIYVGYAALAVGVLAWMASTIVRPNEKPANVLLWSGRVAAGIGLFFIACQLAGIMLGASPAINFGDATKFEFVMVPFWQIGAGFLLAGILYGFVTSRLDPSYT
jgi:hypothetical protein